MFHIGQKVVCINAAEIGGIWWADKPHKGAIYTVEGFVDLPGTYSLAPVKTVGLLLKEIKNCLLYHGSYDPDRFRPVIERETNISVFTDLLVPTELEKVS